MSRPFTIAISTSDPTIFDRLPDTDGNYEAVMVQWATGDTWTKQVGQPERSTTAAAGFVVVGDTPKPSRDPWANENPDEGYCQLPACGCDGRKHQM
jgi:hypothetical protein